MLIAPFALLALYRRLPLSDRETRELVDVDVHDVVDDVGRRLLHQVRVLAVLDGAHRRKRYGDVRGGWTGGCRRR